MPSGLILSMSSETTNAKTPKPLRCTKCSGDPQLVSRSTLVQTSKHPASTFEANMLQTISYSHSPYSRVLHPQTQPTRAMSTFAPFPSYRVSLTDLHLVLDVLLEQLHEPSLRNALHPLVEALDHLARACAVDQLVTVSLQQLLHLENQRLVQR